MSSLGPRPPVPAPDAPLETVHRYLLRDRLWLLGAVAQARRLLEHEPVVGCNCERCGVVRTFLGESA